MNVVRIVKSHSDRLVIGQFIAAIVSGGMIILEMIEEEEETTEDEEDEEMILQKGKCILQPVTNVETIVNYHSSLLAISQSSVLIVL